VVEFLGDADAFYLLVFLRAHNGQESIFIIANGLAETIGWPRKRLAAARKRLEGTHVHTIRHAGRYTGPALYAWTDYGRKKTPLKGWSKMTELWAAHHIGDVGTWRGCKPQQRRAQPSGNVAPLSSNAGTLHRHMTGHRPRHRAESGLSLDDVYCGRITTC
jgi:hypothetical protein